MLLARLQGSSEVVVALAALHLQSQQQHLTLLLRLQSAAQLQVWVLALQHRQSLHCCLPVRQLSLSLLQALLLQPATLLQLLPLQDIPQSQPAHWQAVAEEPAPQHRQLPPHHPHLLQHQQLPLLLLLLLFLRLPLPAQLGLLQQD
jgi:hypothetical protein